jgi:trigger factor
MDSQLAEAGLTKEDYAQSQDKTVEELDKEIEDNSAGAIKAQFVLDAIAKKEELSVDESDITDQIVRRAQQVGVRADEYAQQLVSAGQLGALMSDIMRGKALALVLERAKISDDSGNEIDLNTLTAQVDEPVADDVADEPAADDAPDLGDGSVADQSGDAPDEQPST